MEAKRGSYQPNGIATQADALEAVLTAHGIDPLSTESWPIWTIWEQRGLADALDALTERLVHSTEGEAVMPRKKSQTLTELRARFEECTSQLRAIDSQMNTVHAAWQAARQRLRTSTDSRAIQLAQAELTLARNQGDQLSIERRRIGEQVNKAEISYRAVERAVATAQASLAFLAAPRDFGDNSVRLAPGDLARLRRANRAILEKYGVTEQEESNHAYIK